MLKISTLIPSMAKSRFSGCVSYGRKGTIYALIGSNGAGKTTLLKTISGWLQPASGTIEFLDKRIDRLPPMSIVEMGIAYIPEGGRLFPDMTVRENLEMGLIT